MPLQHEFGSERLPNYNEGMVFDDYKLVIYRNKVFHLIEEEYRAAGQTLPRDTTEIEHA